MTVTAGGGTSLTALVAPLQAGLGVKHLWLEVHHNSSADGAQVGRLQPALAYQPAQMLLCTCWGWCRADGVLPLPAS